MPTVSSPKQVLKGNEGDEFQCVAGDIVKVFEGKTFKGKKGPGYVQHIVIGPGELKCTLWNQDEISDDMVGATIRLTHNSGSKKPCLILKEDTYKGRTSLILDVNEKAHVEVGGGEPPEPKTKDGGDEKANEGSPESDFEPQNKAAESPAPKSARVEEAMAAIADAKFGLAQVANAYNLCIDAVTKLVLPHFEEVLQEPMPPELFQAAVSTFFIAADRKGLVHGLPAKPIKDLMKDK